MKTVALLLFSAALLSPMAARAAESVPALTFATLAKTVAGKGGTPSFPKALSGLDGKKVSVTGYISPYDQHALRLKKFILTPELNPGCYQCNPPDDNAVVFVRLPASATPMAWKSDTVTVQGTLHLKGSRKDDKEADAFYVTLDDAVVTARK